MNAGSLKRARNTSSSPLEVAVCEEDAGVKLMVPPKKLPVTHTLSEGAVATPKPKSPPVASAPVPTSKAFPVAASSFARNTSSNPEDVRATGGPFVGKLALP